MKKKRSTKKKKKRRKTLSLFLPHPAHVGREVEDLVAARDDLLAVVVDAQVDEVELVAELLLLLICLEVNFDGRKRRKKSAASEKSERKGKRKTRGRQSSGGRKDSDLLPSDEHLAALFPILLNAESALPCQPTRKPQNDRREIERRGNSAGGASLPLGRCPSSIIFR